jgi:hypothetical protein
VKKHRLKSKAKRVPPKVLMERANQVTSESALRESEKDSAKLSALVSQKRLSVDEKEERDAIRRSKDHCEFYVMFVQKMRCMVTACETQASGMVACGNDKSFSSFAVKMVQKQTLL